MNHIGHLVEQAKKDCILLEAARAFAAAGTTLRPGDLLVGPSAGEIDELPDGSVVAIEIVGIGALSATTAPR